VSIVAGVSNTPLAPEVVRAAVEESHRRSTGVVLVSNVGSPRSRDEAIKHPDNRAAREGWLQGLAAQAREHGATEVEVYLPATPGELSDAILEASELPGAELVVIGIPRRSRVGKVLLGSSSQDVLLRCDLPVLGVKLPADQEA
jgi:nucleotide-binding universal stress UspA family protein